MSNYHHTTDYKTATRQVLTTLIKDFSCGWFDGGCYTLTTAICEYDNSLLAYHASRTSNGRDHAIAFCPETNLYFDADGWQTESELIHKMRTVELVNVTVVEPFPDLTKYPIYGSVKELLLSKFLVYTPTPLHPYTQCLIP
jgi:hypothetical protein